MKALILSFAMCCTVALGEESQETSVSEPAAEAETGTETVTPSAPESDTQKTETSDTTENMAEEPKPVEEKPVRRKWRPADQAQGSEAPNRFRGDEVIYSKYRLEGKNLEVDPD